jgi:hypothetical protein
MSKVIELPVLHAARRRSQRAPRQTAVGSFWDQPRLKQQPRHYRERPPNPIAIASFDVTDSRSRCERLPRREAIGMAVLELLLENRDCDHRHQPPGRRRFVPSGGKYRHMSDRMIGQTLNQCV